MCLGGTEILTGVKVFFVYMHIYQSRTRPSADYNGAFLLSILAMGDYLEGGL